MEQITAGAKPSHRKLNDEPMLLEMAKGIISQKYKDPTNAAKAVLRAHGHVNDGHEDSNVRRLLEKYRKENWFAVGREAYLQEEFRRRHPDGRPKSNDPVALRLYAYGCLVEAIEGYMEYAEKVEGENRELGMDYLLEDWLWDWDPHVDFSREAVEFLLESARNAVHRFYEGMISKGERRLDDDGNSGSYPLTVATIVVDPFKPLDKSHLRPVGKGLSLGGGLKVAYGRSEDPDPRWLEAETKRYKDYLHKQKAATRLPVWRWPEPKHEVG